jgi:hypothetical protein
MEITVKFPGEVEAEVFYALELRREILQDRLKMPHLHVDTSRSTRERIKNLEAAMALLTEARLKAEKRKPRRTSAAPAASFSELSEVDD